MNAILAAIVTTVHDAGEMGAPSGHIYAALMGHGVDLGTYQDIVRILSASGLVTENGHLLRVTVKGAELARKIDEATRSAKGAEASNG